MHTVTETVDEQSVDVQKAEWLEDFKKLQLGPNDVLIVRSQWTLRPADRESLKGTFREYFPNNNVLIIPKELEIGVITNP